MKPRLKIWPNLLCHIYSKYRNDTPFFLSFEQYATRRSFNNHMICLSFVQSDL